MKIISIKFSPEDTRFRLLPRFLSCGFSFTHTFYQYSWLYFRIVIKKKGGLNVRY